MKTKLFVTFLLIAGSVHAQTCVQNFTEAQRAYANGQLQQVETLLDGCLDDLDKDIRSDALKLLINANLLDNEDDKADLYMHELLTINPYYKLRDDDLAEFKSLYQTYTIRSKYAFGITSGAIFPDYVVLYQHGISGQTIQETDYDEIPGFYLGINGFYEIIRDFYLEAGIRYTKRGFIQEETQMNFRTMTSRESNHTLNIPLQAKYRLQIRDFGILLGGGYALDYLINSQANIDNWPLNTGIISLNGNPVSVKGYDLTNQRMRFCHSWIVSGALQYSLAQYIIQLDVSYQRGFTSLIDGASRYDNQELLETYAYVPDDYKVNAFMVGISFMKNISKPRKK